MFRWLFGKRKKKRWTPSPQKSDNNELVTAAVLTAANYPAESDSTPTVQNKNCAVDTVTAAKVDTITYDVGGYDSGDSDFGGGGDCGGCD